MPATARPLQVTQSDRRELLSGRLVPIVEGLIEREGGFAELSVEAIIRAGGISRSTFYAYFADKSDLLGAMARHVVADVLDSGDSWWSLPGDAGRERLREALRPPVDAYRAHATLLGAVVEAAAYDARSRDQLNRLVGGASGALEAHIRACQLAGTAPPELDPKRSAEWLIWMIERGLYQLVSGSGDREAARLLESLTDLVWRALYSGYR